MSQTSDEMRSFLHDAGILAETHPNETCMIVMPNFRLRSGQVALLFQANGIRCRALGHGTGLVRDAKGQKKRVRGILVLAINRLDVQTAKMYSRLFGVESLAIDANGQVG